MMLRLAGAWLISTALLSGGAFAAEATGDLFVLSDEFVSPDMLHGAVC